MTTVLRPSAAGIWTRCTGAPALCRGLPERPAGQPAKEGTAAHALAELCLKNGETNADDYIGQVGETPEGKESEFPDGLPVWDADMAAAVNVYLDTVYSVLRPEHFLFVELNAVAVPETKGNFGTFKVEGTTDTAIYAPESKALHIFDFKYGYGVVEAEDNRQLSSYTLAAIRYLKEVHEAEVSHVTMTIVQPRASHPAGPVRSISLDAFGIWDLDAMISGAVRNIADGLTELVSGDHCKYCEAQFNDTCPVRKAEFKTAFNSIILPEVLADLDADDIGARLNEADAIESYIADLRARAETMAKRGKLPTGRKLVAGQGKREFAIEPETAIKYLEDETGEQLSEEKTIYPTMPQAEKALGKKRFSEAAAAIAEKHAITLVSFKPGNPKLVPVSAPGDAIDITAASGAFSAITPPPIAN